MSDNNTNAIEQDSYNPLDIAAGELKKERVPKFEQDLAEAGGNVKTLAAKKTVKKSSGYKNRDVDTQKTANDDLKVNEESEKKVELTQDSAEEDSVFEFAQYHDKSLDEALPFIAPPPDEEMDYDKMDFSNDYDEDVPPPTETIVLEEMAAPTKPKLASMTDSTRSAAQSLMKQMMMDDLDIELEDTKKTSLDDLSDEYNDNSKRTEELAAKDVLDQDEKKLIKERLMNDIGYRPSNVNQKASNTMYNSLIAEKKIKASKRGFSIILLLVMFGVIDAFVVMYRINWNESQLFSYLSLATALFSILMFIKKRPAKITCTIFFGLETITLIGPGFVKFVLDNLPQTEGYMETLIFFLVAIILTGTICLFLAKNENINAYVTTNIKEEKKKIQQAEKILSNVKK